MGEIQRERVEQIVVGGDVVPGPMPREVMALLVDLEIPVRFIRGDGARAVLGRLDGVETDSVPEQFREIIRWSGEELTPDASLGPVFEHVRAHVVVCGHTHMQFDRWVGDAGAIRAGRTAVVSGSAKPRFSA